MPFGLAYVNITRFQVNILGSYRGRLLWAESATIKHPTVNREHDLGQVSFSAGFPSVQVNRVEQPGKLDIRKQVRVKGDALYCIVLIRNEVIMPKEVQIFRVFPKERDECCFAVGAVWIMIKPLIHHFPGYAHCLGMVFYAEVYKWGNRAPVCGSRISDRPAVVHHLLKRVVELFVKGHGHSPSLAESVLSVWLK